MKVLLVEDDPFLQVHLVDQITELGYDILGPFSRDSDALQACENQMPDVALLDFNLGNFGDSQRVADFLEANEVPFSFASGHTIRNLPKRFAHVQVIGKPYGLNDLAEFLNMASNVNAARSSD